MLSRQHSPLTIRGLSPFMRIMYCSGVWSYIVGAVTTPLFIIIPLLTIWAGIFPIVISWWAALALTVYYVAQSLVLNYSKKVSWLLPLLCCRDLPAVLSSCYMLCFATGCLLCLQTVTSCAATTCLLCFQAVTCCALQQTACCA